MNDYAFIERVSAWNRKRAGQIKSQVTRWADKLAREYPPQSLRVKLYSGGDPKTLNKVIDLCGQHVPIEWEE